MGCGSFARPGSDVALVDLGKSTLGSACFFDRSDARVVGGRQTDARQSFNGVARLTPTQTQAYVCFVVAKGKHTQRGVIRISRKNEATIPIDALQRAGFEPADELIVETAGAGRIVLVRAVDLVERHAGNVNGQREVALAHFRYCW
jgi:bifunctional DNA-binding transcriptional regulator/antitoxin component of YhaV-PrlF toxin-antitoxin module